MTLQRSSKNWGLQSPSPEEFTPMHILVSTRIQGRNQRGRSTGGRAPQ